MKKRRLNYKPISIVKKRDLIFYQPCFLDIINYRPRTKAEIDRKYKFGLDIDLKNK